MVSVLRGLGNIHANYNDVVHTLNQLAMNQAMSTPVAMNPLHNQDMQIVESVNKESKSFHDTKEVNVDNASVEHSSSKKSNWWPALGMRRASWSKPKRARTTDNQDSSHKELPTHHELSDEELASMLNR